MNYEVTFSGSGEMDNGWNVTVSMQLDNNAAAAAGNHMDNRSLKIDMSDMGTLTFYGHGADTAMSMMDDKMPHLMETKHGTL